MNDKEPFEDIIASKFSEAEFPFDEANWDNAEDMISVYRAKQKRRRTGLVFFSGIALGVLIMLPFVVRLNKTNNTIAEVTNIPTQNAHSEEVIPSVHQQPGQVSLDNEIVYGEANTPSSPSANDEQAPVNTTPQTSDTKIAAVSSFRKVVKNRINRTKENGTITAPAAIVPSVSSVAPVENSETKQDKLTVWDKIKNDIIRDQDTVPEVVLLPELEKPSPPPTSMLPWNFSASAGANYVNSFSCNPIQGIEVSKAIKPYFEVGAGVYYTYLSIRSGGVKTITTRKEYGFGYKADVTEIKTDKLHYAVFPVYAKCNIDDKNSFIIGANMFTLITVSNSLTSYKESYGEKQGAVSKKTTGYSNGINTFDVGLLVGYKRHLFWNIGAAVYFNFGLVDIKKNAYYNQNKFDRNISGQFMLTYKL